MPPRFLTALALLAASGTTLAHPGAEAHLHASGALQALAAGLRHPLTGWDHLLAMLALGLWCGLVLARQWLPPLAFAASMALGLALTQTPLALPAVEPMVAASLLAFGLLLVVQRLLPMAWALALAAGFALFHGYAHGEALPPEAAAQVFWAYLGGMLAATLGLHAAGVLAGRWLRRQPASLPVWAGRTVGWLALGCGAVALAA